MARFLTRIATRMWLLSGAMAGITLLVVIGAWYVAVSLHLMESPREMPPEVRAELRQLAKAGRIDRYVAVVDNHRKGNFRAADWIYLGSVGVISTIVGGGFGLLLARRITRPIGAVAHAAAQVAAGNRSIRVDAANTSGETRELVESFNMMAGDIETFERERRVLTAGIAHELRTPLTILGGRLHGLIDGVIEPGPDESSRLLRQVDHLTRLVDDLRTLAHAEAGELGLEQRRIDPGDTIRAVVVDLQPAAEAAGARITHRLQPMMLSADPDRLYQILANLVTNAIKHSPQGGEIRVIAERRVGEALLSVIDDGPGLPSEEAQRVFLPFWRGRASIDAGHKGSGLGLALAAGLADAHGGSLSAANRIGGQGAVFQLRLPIGEDDPYRRRRAG